jgi:hypothetical protein
MIQNHPADHYIVRSWAHPGIRSDWQGHFSTVAHISQETKMASYASKYKQLIGLGIFAFVTNLQLLFPVELR